MRKLIRTLKKMGRIQFRMFTAAHSSKHDSSVKLVRHRLDFNEACSEFIVNLQEFLRETDDVEKFLRMQTDFDEMRSAHVEHQLVWTPEAIAADHALYLERSQRIGLLTRNFLDNSMVAIEFGTMTEIEAATDGLAD